MKNSAHARAADTGFPDDRIDAWGSLCNMATEKWLHHSLIIFFTDPMLSMSKNRRTVKENHNFP
jgi:hypothetical protein